VTYRETSEYAKCVLVRRQMSVVSRPCYVDREASRRRSRRPSTVSSVQIEVQRYWLICSTWNRSPCDRSVSCLTRANLPHSTATSAFLDLAVNSPVSYRDDSNRPQTAWPECYKFYLVITIDQKHVRTAEFLRESIVARDIVGRYGHLSFLSKSELSCVIDYLANS